MILFVWIAGTELDLRQAWTERRDSCSDRRTCDAHADAGRCPDWPGFDLHSPAWVGSQARSWQFVAGIGMASGGNRPANPDSVHGKARDSAHPAGQRVLRYASLDDLVIWGVLALILLDVERLGKQAAFAAGFALATLALRRGLPRLPDADRWFVSLIWLAACALAADWAGLHYMVGAFLAGCGDGGRMAGPGPTRSPAPRPSF